MKGEVMTPEPVGKVIPAPQSSDARESDPVRADHTAEALRPHGQWQQWTETVRALPGTPLMIERMEDSNSEELLANDSLGG